MAEREIPRRPRVALGLVAAASRLVTRTKRGRWRREWEAEILARWDALVEAGTVTTAARLDLAARAAGSVVDALLYDRGRWGMEGFVQDLAVAARTLSRRRGIALVVVLTLGLGIGASTAMFSIAKDVLLRPFPYPDPQKVVAVEGVARNRPTVSGNVTYPNIHDLGASTTSFEGVGATRWWKPALEDDRGSRVLRGATVTANYFDILGVRAGAGRFFRPDEQGEDRDDLVVITHAFWADRYASDPAVVGRALRLDGIAYRVIGVTAPDFEDPWLLDGPGLEPQVFRTVDSPPSDWPRSGRSWKAIARIRPDASIRSAQDEVDAVFAGLAERFPEANANRALRLVPLRDRIAGPARPILVTLLAAVGTLLMVACANLANLLLGRALDRQGEFAVQKALGAPAWRLFQRGLAEAILLSIVGGALGVGLALGLVDLATGLGPVLPRPVTGRVDGALLSFSVAVTLAAGLLVGLAPALHAARTGPSAAGRDSSRVTVNARGQRLREALVVAELALTTALLIGAGLLVRSMQHLGRVDLGIRTAGVATVELHGSAWWGLEPADALAQWNAVMQAVRGVPGVEAAGAIDYVPFSGDYSCDGILREDRPPPPPGEGMCAETRMILPGTLDALGVPLVRGRLLASTDLAGQPNVAVIDRNLADAMWPGEDPIGERLRVHGDSYEIVGVAGNMLHFGPRGTVRPQLYLHAAQDRWSGLQRGLTVVAHGSDAGALVAPIRAAVVGVNPAIAVGGTTSLAGFLRVSLAAERFRTALMSAFGVTALLLALMGIAGVMGYSVSKRRREMGLRLALGAEPAEVRGLVFREGVRLGIVGIGLGALGALLVAGFVDKALLFETGVRDPAVYVAVVVLLGASTLIACYLPASRASSVDPVTALAES